MLLRFKLCSLVKKFHYQVLKFVKYCTSNKIYIWIGMCFGHWRNTKCKYYSVARYRPMKLPELLKSRFDQLTTCPSSTPRFILVINSDCFWSFSSWVTNNNDYVYTLMWSHGSLLYKGASIVYLHQKIVEVFNVSGVPNLDFF